jgi:hypothetical protein
VTSHRFDERPLTVGLFGEGKRKRLNLRRIRMNLIEQSQQRRGIQSAAQGDGYRHIAAEM